jgi:hypothetical protein
MEAINDSTRLIAQAIEFLNELRLENPENLINRASAIVLLKTALDKLVVEI